jgi:hypothetical protein
VSLIQVGSFVRSSRSGYAVAFISHSGKPPNFHSAQTYGPTRRFTNNPSLAAIETKRFRSTTSQSVLSGASENAAPDSAGSCAFQKTYTCTMFSPLRRICRNVPAHSPGGTRAGCTDPESHSVLCPPTANDRPSYSTAYGAPFMSSNVRNAPSLVENAGLAPEAVPAAEPSSVAAVRAARASAPIGRIVPTARPQE